MNEQTRPPEPPKELPKIESLADRTKRFLTEFVADWLKMPIAEVGRWARSRVTPYVVGLVLLCAGLVFVLVGGIQGLQSIQGMPPWVPWLGIGVVAAIAGGLAMRK